MHNLIARLTNNNNSNNNSNNNNNNNNNSDDDDDDEDDHGVMRHRILFIATIENVHSFLSCYFCYIYTININEFGDFS